MSKTQKNFTIYLAALSLISVIAKLFFSTSIIDIQFFSLSFPLVNPAAACTSHGKISLSKISHSSCIPQTAVKGPADPSTVFACASCSVTL